MVAASARLLPPSLFVDALVVADGGITIRAIADGSDGRCPVCGEPADRVHSRPHPHARRPAMGRGHGPLAGPYPEVLL